MALTEATADSSGQRKTTNATNYLSKPTQLPVMDTNSLIGRCVTLLCSQKSDNAGNGETMNCE